MHGLVDSCFRRNDGLKVALARLQEVLRQYLDGPKREEPSPLPGRAPPGSRSVSVRYGTIVPASVAQIQ